MSLKRVAVATKHGKLAQIARAFEALPNWELQLAEIDTDVFGTFSGEIKRTLSPKDAAIQKALAGAQHLGFEYGLASEGTIGPDPNFPLVVSDLEVIALVNASGHLVIVETYLSNEIVAASKKIKSESDFEGLAQLFDLPNHAAMVFARFDHGLEIVKGIHSLAELESLLLTRLESGASEVWVESDLRAMHSPSRQRNIEACAKKLAARLGSHCPNCDQFGWGVIGYEYGVPCSGCFEIANLVPRAKQLGCVSCDYVELLELETRSVDPSRCQLCNP